MRSKRISEGGFDICYTYLKINFNHVYINNDIFTQENSNKPLNNFNYVYINNNIFAQENSNKPLNILLAPPLHQPPSKKY